MNHNLMYDWIMFRDYKIGCSNFQPYLVILIGGLGHVKGLLIAPLLNLNES